MHRQIQFALSSCPVSAGQYTCVGLWESRLPSHDKAGNIGTEPIGMTVLQQEHPCMAPPKKQLRISGKMSSLRGASTAHLSRVCNHAWFSEEMGPVVCPSRESRGGSSLTVPSLSRPI